ncbi:sialate O-acetylesterase [Bradyrhizobium sp. LA2.1]|uniref:sialate O-acetylesterase n=1 Tax=Bradyrhizobium sp. LA2.1 TaxID=3156376 RepID=UPI00339A5968
MRFLIVAALCLVPQLCSAQQRSALSNDPFVLTENSRADAWNNNAGYSDTSARTLRSLQSVDTSKKNLILITAGDSNMASVGPSAYSVVNTSTNDNLNVYNGAIYGSSDPMLSATYFPAYGSGGISAQVADKFITAGTFDRVIVVPLAVGGSTAAMWAAGGALYNRIPVAMARLAARGITPSTTNCTFALLFQIGANDTGAGTSQASFQASITQSIARALGAGFSGRIFIPQYSRLSGGTSATIRAAQSALIDNVTIFDGGDIDAITATGSNLQADSTHFSTSGQTAVATQYKTKMTATGAPF